MTNIKKFKDTKLAKFFTEKHPKLLVNILDTADDFFPPAKLLTAIVKANSNLSEEEKNEIETNIAQYHNDEYAQHLADVQDARDMYKESEHQMSDHIAKRVVDWNLLIIFFLVGVQVAAVYFIKVEIAAVVTGVIGTITGALINERSTVINFFFGSSKGGQQNSEVMRKMAQGE